jgi:hypothetical protein
LVIRLKASGMKRFHPRGLLTVMESDEAAKEKAERL